MKKIITIALASIMVAGAVTSMAQVRTGPANPKIQHRQHMKQHAMAQLNLTKAQKAEIKTIHQNARAKMMNIKASNQSQAAKKASAKAVRVRAKDQMMRVLTKEQREKLQTMRSKAKNHRIKKAA